MTSTIPPRFPVRVTGSAGERVFELRDGVPLRVFTDELVVSENGVLTDYEVYTVSSGKYYRFDSSFTPVPVPPGFGDGNAVSFAVRLLQTDTDLTPPRRAPPKVRQAGNQAAGQMEDDAAGAAGSKAVTGNEERAKELEKEAEAARVAAEAAQSKREEAWRAVKRADEAADKEAEQGYAQAAKHIEERREGRKEAETMQTKEVKSSKL